MALSVRLLLALIVVGSAGLAVLGPAPSARSRALWLRPALAVLAAVAIWSAVAARAGWDGALQALVCAAALLLALAVWLHRGEDPPRPPDDDEDVPPPPPPDHPDWERWERELEGHAAR